MKIKSHPLLLLLLLFAAAFALRALFPDTSYFFWDESVYMLHGKLFSGQEVGYSETFLRPPLLPLLLSPLSLFASLSSYELTSRLLMALLNSLAVFPAYFLTKAMFNKKPAVAAVAAVAAAIVAVLPVHILNSRWVMTDALGALLAFSSVTAYLAGFKTGKKLLLYAGGVLTGLAVLMKFTNLLLLVLLLPLLLVNLRKRLADVAVSAALFAVVILPYLIFNAMSFGSPFYAFGRAFHVVAEQETAGLGFLLYLLNDSLGFLAAFLALGAAFSIFSVIKRPSLSQWKLQKQNWDCPPYMLYCLFATLAYSLFIVGRGVSKPFGLEWEAERFLLLFTLFAVPFISYGLVQSFALLRNLRRAVAVFVVIAVTTAAIFSLYPQFVRAYAPAIAHEDGLRNVTKEIGLSLRSNSEIVGFGCVGNCPPVAYYSGKKMSVYYATSDLEAANHSNAVVFDGSKEELSGYSVAKEFCSSSHCAYLLSRR